MSSQRVISAWRYVSFALWLAAGTLTGVALSLALRAGLSWLLSQVY